MDTAWIQVFVLTLMECVAPAGKTVCQERELELQFLTEGDCKAALEQLVQAKDALDNVIVDMGRSGCSPSAREHATFASLDDLAAAVEDKTAFREPAADQAPASNATRTNHMSRLDGLKTCEETKGVAPCKIGEIIIEAASDEPDSKPVEVWRRDR